MESPSANPQEYRDLDVQRHQDAVENGTLPKYYDEVKYLSTPKKDTFVYETSDDLLQIMMGTDPVDEMIEDLMQKYEKKGLSEMLEEVNAAAKDAGIEIE